MEGQEEPECTVSGPCVRPSYFHTWLQTLEELPLEKDVNVMWVDGSTNENRMWGLCVLLVKSCGKNEKEKVSSVMRGCEEAHKQSGELIFWCS